MKNDEEWMSEYCKGSEEAFGFLYEKYAGMVFAFIKRRLRESEAEDFYQKVWRQLHEKKDVYKGQPFAPWFFVLIRNLLIDEYRSLYRKSVKNNEEIIEKLYTPSATDEELEELLQKLPQDTQELVRKYYLEGVSYQELENETGLSQTNLRQRLSRAVRGLRKHHEE